MKILSFFFVLFLSLPINSHALTCDSKDLFTDGSKNNNKLWAQAKKMGIGYDGREYQNLVYDICDGDEKMLNINIRDGVYFEKDVNGYRKILNKPKTTNEFPTPFNRYSDYIKYPNKTFPFGYPTTVNYVLECAEKSKYISVECSSLIGLLRGDNDFKKVYDKYWMDAKKISNVNFDMFSSIKILIIKNKIYFYLNAGCKYVECEKSGISNATMLYDISEKRMFGYYQDLDYKTHIYGIVTNLENGLLENLAKNDGLSGIVSQNDINADIINIR
ncbi:hypothetical protein [Desulfobulbus propionicus]